MICDTFYHIIGITNYICKQIPCHIKNLHDMKNYPITWGKGHWRPCDMTPCAEIVVRLETMAFHAVSDWSCVLCDHFIICILCSLVCNWVSISMNCTTTCTNNNLVRVVICYIQVYKWAVNADQRKHTSRTDKRKRHFPRNSLIHYPPTWMKQSHRSLNVFEYYRITKYNLVFNLSSSIWNHSLVQNLTIKLAALVEPGICCFFVS